MGIVSRGNFRVELLKHSIGRHGLEVVTYLATYERFIHADFLRHRMLSQSYSSSRAIPYDKMNEWTELDLAMPVYPGRNVSGMQSGALVDDPEGLNADLRSLYQTVRTHTDYYYQKHKPHKEIINKYLEPWGWITGVITGGRSAFMNMFNLRVSRKAHPNIQRLAVTMARLYRISQPQRLEVGEWHLPFVDSVEGNAKNLIWSSARCAWTSYNNATKDADFVKAKKRHDECIEYKHVSPLEHQLECREDFRKSGLVSGYNSYRMMIPGESATDFDFGILDEYGDRDFIPDI